MSTLGDGNCNLPSMLRELIRVFEGVLLSRKECYALRCRARSPQAEWLHVRCEGMLCLAMSVYTTAIHWRVSIINKVALQLDGRARSAALLLHAVCGGIGQEVRSRWRCAKSACLRCSASPCQYTPPRPIDVLRNIPKQLCSQFKELVSLFCRWVWCVVV